MSQKFLANSMDPDKTAWMHRLIWVHAGRKRTMLVFMWRGSNGKTYYSAPEKPFTYQDCHRVGAFVQHFTDNKHSDADDVPFLSLLQQVKLDGQDKDKTDSTKLDASKATSSTKTESSRDTSESALSESKTSTSSQVSAPDDFVMVELKTPFAGADANSDLGKFYRECQSAPALTNCDEEQSVPEALEQLTTQLETFETNMKDFDSFVSELSIESESMSSEPKAEKVFET